MKQKKRGSNEASRREEGRNAKTKASAADLIDSASNLVHPRSAQINVNKEWHVRLSKHYSSPVAVKLNFPHLDGPAMQDCKPFVLREQSDVDRVPASPKLNEISYLNGGRRRRVLFNHSNNRRPKTQRGAYC